PIGCPIAISISNDSSSPVFSVPCPYQILNGHGVVIDAPLCPAPAIPPNPGATFTAYWTQVDANGHPVPPGSYTVVALLPPGFGAQAFSITIGGAVSGVAALCVAAGGNIGAEAD